MSGGQDPSGKGKYRAEDLGPSGFDPHAPYQPVELPLGYHAMQATTNQEKNLALLAHLLGCLSVLAGSVFGFVGPLVIWLTQKDVSSYVEEQAREALNFQITLLILAVGCGMLVFATCGMLFPILFIPVVVQVIFGIIATLSVANGKAYHYPFNFRLIK